MFTMQTKITAAEVHMLDVRSQLSLWEEMRQNNYSLLDVRLSELHLTRQNLKVSLRVNTKS